jgi:dTDP-4-dehydrorhamnose reductase
MKILVLGYKGTLGRYVYTYLKSKNYDIIGLSRENLDVSDYDEGHLRAVFLHKSLKKNDVIINCIGAIKPMVDKYGTLNAIKINSLFPHLLSNGCEKDGHKMIHITTDCVFSGNDGLYNENSPHDCIDVYGKTKSLGEPANCTVVRTSIIGEEIDTSRSLLEWIKSTKDKTANGFTNHKWNGLTCLQVAKVFEEIIKNDYFWKGVRHIHSPNIFTKLEIVQTVSDIYDLNITLNPVEAAVKCDRTMSTIYNDIKFDIPDIKTQIKEQYEYKPILISNII